MELAKNQEHTVTIEGYGEGGMGVARIDGRVVFVHGALRGEAGAVLSKAIRLCLECVGIG
jgi:23S rRNA (uracil1939-C5)-methyltransferase